jgi:hypothetical protein
MNEKIGALKEAQSRDRALPRVTLGDEDRLGVAAA